MASKAATPEPLPTPKVGGSFTLNPTTGEWVPTPVEPDQTPEPTTSSDGTDS